MQIAMHGAKSVKIFIAGHGPADPGPDGALPLANSPLDGFIAALRVLQNRNAMIRHTGGLRAFRRTFASLLRESSKCGCCVFAYCCRVLLWPPGKRTFSASIVTHHNAQPVV